MPYLQLPTVTLYYELHGRTRNPPLLLLHGATETFQDGWRRQIAPFSADYCVVGLDLRGHGRSTNVVDRLDLREMADDVVALLDYLGYDQAHVCGHSGGASVALFFAVRHPARLRTLVLISNNFELDTMRTGPARFWDPERIRREEPHWWEAMARLHQVEVPRLLRWWAAEDVVRPNFAAADLAHIDVPALVVGGDRDHIIPLEQTLKLHRALPNSELFIFPGVGHGIPRRRAEGFNRLVLDFLRRHQDGDASPSACE